MVNIRFESLTRSQDHCKVHGCAAGELISACCELDSHAHWQSKSWELVVHVFLCCDSFTLVLMFCASCSSRYIPFNVDLSLCWSGKP